MPKKVTYDEDALVITIQTNDPAALHEKLLRGLTDASRNFVDNKNEKRINERLALIDLLECLLPDEVGLSKIYA